MFPYILRIMEKQYTKKKAQLSIIIVIVLHIIIGKASSVLPLPSLISWDFPSWVTYVLPLTRLGDFIIGCNMGYLFITRKKDTEIKPGIVAILEVISVLLAIGTCTLYYYVSSINNVPAANWWIYTLLFMIPSMLLIFLSSNNNNTISKLLSNKILVHVGNISSSLFLIHQMVYKYSLIIRDTILKDVHLAEWCYVIAVLIISILLAEIWNIFYKQINKNIYALSTQ